MYSWDTQPGSCLSPQLRRNRSILTFPRHARVFRVAQNNLSLLAPIPANRNHGHHFRSHTIRRRCPCFPPRLQPAQPVIPTGMAALLFLRPASAGRPPCSGGIPQPVCPPRCLILWRWPLTPKQSRAARAPIAAAPQPQPWFPFPRRHHAAAEPPSGSHSRIRPPRRLY